MPDIEKAMREGSDHMGQLLLETIFVLLNRVLLRTALKTSDSLELMFVSMNAANGYGCASAGRSVIEHAALLQSFADEIPWRASSVVAHAAMLTFMKRLFTYAQGSTFDWDKLLSGQVTLGDLIASKAWRRPRDERIPHIGTLVEALDRSMASAQPNGVEGHIQLLYSCMSDVVHPSWGGDFIYAPEMYRHIKPERTFDEHFRRIATLFCLPAFNVAHHLVMILLSLKRDEPRLLAMGGRDQ